MPRVEVSEVPVPLATVAAALRQAQPGAADQPPRRRRPQWAFAGGESRPAWLHDFFVMERDPQTRLVFKLTCRGPVVTFCQEHDDHRAIGQRVLTPELAVLA